MLTVWRLTTARFARTAFSGDGARLYGGRWNRKGVRLVYTAATQCLAMLEMLVQDEPPRARYVMIEARIPSAVIPAETNYLLNPLHPDFRRIKIGKPRRFETDLRLITAAGRK